MRKALMTLFGIGLIIAAGLWWYGSRGTDRSCYFRDLDSLDYRCRDVERREEVTGPLLMAGVGGLLVIVAVMRDRDE